MTPHATLASSTIERATALSQVTFCVLDLETTGCDASSDRITEVGAVTVRGGEHLGTFHTLVNARQSIPTQVALLTGISDSMLASAPPVEQVLPSLLEFIRGTIVVGHNVRFDLRFLNSALERYGYDTPIAHEFVDTVPLARGLLRDEVIDCRLPTLATMLGFENMPTHRALDDARATVDLLHLLIERATGFGVLTLDDLIELPGIARHPRAAKLPLTNHLPRACGVYVFHGGRDEVLHVGHATDVRRAVRTYFASRDRRRIAPLLREVRRVSSIQIADPLAADIVAMRLVQRHRPRYDKAAVRASTAACYVHVDPRCRRRPTVVREPRRDGLHVGPLPTRVMGELTVAALHALGDSGAVEVVTGANAVASEAIAMLSARPTVRDGTGTPALAHAARALGGALSRQRLLDDARGRGRVVVSVGDTALAVDHGLLEGAGPSGCAPAPLAVAAFGAAEWAGTDRPIPRWASAEVLRVTKRLRSHET